MPESLVVAIHQPNFFPWMGYFDKIARSDAFIFFDDVQFPKKGGSWSNRVKLLVGEEAKWVTAPISRDYHGTREILEMSFISKTPWREKLLKTIDHNYQRHPYYSETMELVSPLLLNPEPNIAEYNIHAITTITLRLGLDTTKLKRSSELAHRGTSNELLCSLTRALDGDTYMCGGGADGYQDETVFCEQGVTLQFQNYSPSVYPQLRQENFIAGLSIIDAAMNLGWSALGQSFHSSSC